MYTTVKVSKQSYTKILEKIKTNDPPSIFISKNMLAKYGFTTRWDYSCVYLDFKHEKKCTTFILTFSEYIEHEKA